VPLRALPVRQALSQLPVRGAWGWGVGGLHTSNVVDGCACSGVLVVVVQGQSRAVQQGATSSGRGQCTAARLLCIPSQTLLPTSPHLRPCCPPQSPPPHVITHLPPLPPCPPPAAQRGADQAQRQARRRPEAPQHHSATAPQRQQGDHGRQRSRGGARPPHARQAAQRGPRGGGRQDRGLGRQRAHGCVAQACWVLACRPRLCAVSCAVLA
jgi:hypothetical protein